MNPPGVRLRFDRLLRLGVDALPAGLVDTEARQRLLQARVELGACFTFGAVEVRLDDDDRVDALACVSDDDRGFEALPTTVPAALSAAVEHWRSGPRARRGIAALWVELDCIAGVDSEPFAFLRFSPRVDDDDVVAAAAALGSTGATLEQLAVVLAHVRARDVQVLHVAHVGGRVGAAVDVDSGVRLHLGIRRSSVVDVVAPFVVDDVVVRLASLVAAWPDAPLGVQFDVVPGRRCPFVDLELYLPSSPLDDEQWRPALDAIAGVAQVRADKRARIEAWPSREKEPPSSSWPMELWRTLQVKVRLRDGGGAMAKAYLAFSPRLVL